MLSLQIIHDLPHEKLASGLSKAMVSWGRLDEGDI